VEREEAVRHLHENRQRVDRVREETHSSVAASSARMFYQGRVHTADIVRNARNGWTTAREATRNAFVARAKERARAEQARLQADSVNDGREALAAKRHEDAEAMRASIAHIEARDKHLRLADETRKRAAHDAHFESKWAAAEAASAVEGSAYHDVSTAYRRGAARATRTPSSSTVAASPGLVSSVEGASTEGAATEAPVMKSPTNFKPRGTWNNHFGGSPSGWFSSRPMSALTQAID